MGSRTPSETPPIHLVTHIRNAPPLGSVNACHCCNSQENTDWPTVPPKRVTESTATADRLNRFIYSSGFTVKKPALGHRNQMAQLPGVHMHWIRRHCTSGTTSYKWAVSTDIKQLRAQGPLVVALITCTEAMEH